MIEFIENISIKLLHTCNINELSKFLVCLYAYEKIMPVRNIFNTINQYKYPHLQIILNKIELYHLNFLN